MVKRFLGASLFLLFAFLLPARSSAQGVQEKQKMKAVEKELESVLHNHVNGRAITGGINSDICVQAEVDKGKSCVALPKEQWASIKVLVDWPSFQGKIDDTHGYNAVEKSCTSILMGINWLSNQGNRDEKNEWQKVLREKVKSVHCKYDASAAKTPVIDLKAGALTVGYSWDTFSEDRLDTELGQWLMKKL